MSGRFVVHETPIAGLKVLERQPLADRRGYLERLFCMDELAEMLDGRSIAQVNHTLTVERAAVRGLHFQHAPHAETKFVSCLRGEVFDVAVDIRQNSSTFLQWHAQVLTADNHRTFVIPEGFAHGFQTLSDNCEMLYFHTAAYHQAAEGGLNPRDPALAIDWPLAIGELSPRDSAHPMVAEGFSGVDL